jgi:pyridoxamine 5'-phosphate oxidase
MDPIARFVELLNQAIDAALPEPTAAAVATADAAGRPSVRMLLLKGVDARGFTFFTNLGSRKAREMEENPNVALCFHWQPLEAQVRVEGPVERVSDEEADEYFTSRPRASRIGAWASLQSRPLSDRDELEARIREVEARFEGEVIPRPPFWSGFRVVPRRIEFWSGRVARLHDREVYTLDPEAEGGWRIERLYP